MNNINEIRARVIAQEKGFYRIASDKGEKLAEVSGKYMHEAQGAGDYPTVGDYVIASWPEDESHAIISMLFPRKSSFVRKAAGRENREQVVAANIDTVFVCMSLNNDFNLRRLERYLATAWDSGAMPVILLTKKDLCDDLESRILEVESVAVGVDIHAVSSLDDSASELVEMMEAGKTYAFIGSSGVGKSTLINRLMGNEALKTGGLRNDDKGRHTTTHRELIVLPGGAAVIDTPGMRELGMWDHAEGIEAVFADIEALMEDCRFADCTHTNEPGCAVRVAIADGSLDEARWEAFCKLRDENAYVADQGEYLRAKREKFREISKINKKNRKQR